jgi:hypothetical protein
MVLFQNCVRQSRSSTKMATTVQLRCYWKQLWSRWVITGSWEPLVCWWCCNVLTSNQDLWLVGDKMYRDPCCTEKNMFYPKVCIIQLLKVAWYRVIALITLYFFMYDTSIMILALPCNRGLSEEGWLIIHELTSIRSVTHDKYLIFRMQN